MNTDRFLTRVFDKQEKKMLYPFQPSAPEGKIYNKVTINTYNNNTDVYRFEGMNGGFINFFNDKHVWLPFHLENLFKNQDRFVPMLCSGWKDENNKRLIYQNDILESVYYENKKQQKITCRVIFDEISCGFQIKELIYGSVQFSLGKTITCKNKILGNIHENPELLEVKE